VKSPLEVRREELGYSLEEASVETRIPVEHLAALEEGRIEDLPEGPYAKAYLENYQHFLGFDGSAEDLLTAVPLPLEAEPGGTPLSTVRWIASVSCLAFVALLGWRVWQMEASSLPVAEDERPDQVVHIVARRNTRIEVIVDGVVTVDRKVAGGDTVDAAGHDRVEVVVPATENTRIEYNGSVIVPQGRQDLPRRLIFIDDSEAF
jgi:hypothetical protein